MRLLVLIVGCLGISGAATAGELLSAHAGSDAAAGQLLYETRFGGQAPFATSSFQLRFGSDAQLAARQPVPLVAEYRPATATLLVNGLDLSPDLVSRQVEEGGIFSALGGWIPLLIVLGAASIIVIDGNDQDVTVPAGTGGSP